MAEIPDFLGCVTGWRKFALMENGRILTSAGHTSHVWPVADLGEAFCARGVSAYDVARDRYVTHDAPQLGCTCGFYCYKTCEDAQTHAQGSILAKVEIWGRLAEHTRGYRAQHMRIVELYVAPSMSGLVDVLVKRYGVAVFVDEGANKWISESPYVSLSQSQWQNLQNGVYLPYPSGTVIVPTWTSPSLYQQLQNNYQNALGSLQAQAAYVYLNNAGNAAAPETPKTSEPELPWDAFAQRVQRRLERWGLRSARAS